MCSLQCKQGYETQFTNSCSFVSMETRVRHGVHVHVALFPGLPTVQFVVCKNGGGRPDPFYIYHMNDVSVYLGTCRQRGEGSPIEERAWSSGELINPFTPVALDYITIVQQSDIVKMTLVHVYVQKFTKTWHWQICCHGFMVNSFTALNPCHYL